MLMLCDGKTGKGVTAAMCSVTSDKIYWSAVGGRFSPDILEQGFEMLPSKTQTYFKTLNII